MASIGSLTCWRKRTGFGLSPEATVHPRIPAPQESQPDSLLHVWRLEGLGGKKWQGGAGEDYESW